jgi:hypothetical protein
MPWSWYRRRYKPPEQGKSVSAEEGRSNGTHWVFIFA